MLLSGSGTGFEPDMVKFWRTADRNEVDFVIMQTPEFGIAIEIKSDVTKFNPARYRKFVEEYPRFGLQVRALVAVKNRNNLLAL